MESNIRLLRISNEKLTYQNDKAEEKAKEDLATIEQLRTDLQEKTGALDELEAAHKVPGVVATRSFHPGDVRSC